VTVELSYKRKGGPKDPPRFLDFTSRRRLASRVPSVCGCDSAAGAGVSGVEGAGAALGE
jgi:hypothetical protein